MDVTDRVIEIITEHNYSILPISFKELEAFRIAYYKHICELIVSTKKEWVDTITYYCGPRYHDMGVDVAVFKVWFNQMSPGITISKVHLYIIVYWAYGLTFFGMAHTVYVCLGTFYKNIKRDLFLEAHEEFATAYRSEIEYFYGKVDEWDWKGQYLVESVRIISPNGDGVYKPIFYTLDEGDELPLDEIDGEFVAGEFPTVGDDLVFDREDEPEFFSKCYQLADPDDYNYTRCDAIWAENFEFFVEQMKIILELEKTERELAEKKEKEILEYNFRVMEEDLIKTTAEILAAENIILDKTVLSKDKNTKKI